MVFAINEMMTGVLLFNDPPGEFTEVPAVHWPAYNDALQTAYYELMSTPTRRCALQTVGAWLSILVVFSFCFVWPLFDLALIHQFSSYHQTIFDNLRRTVRALWRVG